MDAMDQNPQPNSPSKPTAINPTEAAISAPGSFPDRPLSWWLKKFLACNPFYLVSSALLLYGLYLVSLDGGFLRREIVQLSFNFGALQVYELLLVGTAIVLAQRRIWYDSMLLVGLENLLVLVPFILISQAILLKPGLVWIICGAGGIAALARFWGLKRYFKELNLPRRSLVCGFVLLMINFALPLIFRHLNETKIGTKPTDGAAYEMNRYSWLLLLPAMFALIHLLPRPKQTGELLPQRRWLPTGLFLLWIAASAVHLFSLSYVYNFDWEPVFKAPLVWVVMWSVYFRRADYLERPVPLLSNFLLALPACATLFALGGAGKPIFAALTMCNVAVYLILLVRNRNLFALHLLLASLVALVASLLKPGASPAAPVAFSMGNWLMLSGTVYVLYWVLRSRDPRAGILGAFLTGLGTVLFIPDYYAVQFAAQFALVFLLLHSLRWDDKAHPGARVLRNSVCVIWLVQGSVLLHSHADFGLFLVNGTALLMIAVWVLKSLFVGDWKTISVPVAAIAALLLAPGDFIAGRLQATPEGVLAIGGSFLLFAFGTLAALTKSKWNPPPVFPPVTNSNP